MGAGEFVQEKLPNPPTGFVAQIGYIATVENVSAPFVPPIRIVATALCAPLS